MLTIPLTRAIKSDVSLRYTLLLISGYGGDCVYPESTIGPLMKISIETEVKAPTGDVWKAWVTQADITQWNYATEEWHCPSAEINLELGGKFNYRMEAKDGSMGFNFEGEFTVIDPAKAIHFKLDDDREVMVEFIPAENGTRVVETFEAEDENSAEQQRLGWLAILENFKNYVEARENNL